MKKLRVFLAAVLMASAFTVLAPSPASAKCVGGDDINPCALVCEVGLSNKYTAGLFKFCYVI